VRSSEPGPARATVALSDRPRRPRGDRGRPGEIARTAARYRRFLPMYFGSKETYLPA
jgi:hypothetical protein